MAQLFPQKREGQTVTFVTDLHAGKATYGTNGSSGTYFLTPEQHRIMGEDMDMLSRYSDVVGLGGDLVDWRGTTPEDAEFKAFYNARINRTTKYLGAYGNHDYAAYNSPYPNRNVASLSSSFGFPKFGHLPAGDLATDGVQVVALSQETMRFNEWLSLAGAAADSRPAVKPGRGFQLTDNASNQYDTTTAFGYLRSRLQTGRPTWIMMHYPLIQQYSGGDLDTTTAAKMTDVITKFPNVIGVLSGHRHANFMREAGSVGRTTVTGNGSTRYVASVNAPASGGQIATAGGPSIEYPWDSPFMATVVTYSPGSVLVRFRDLIRRAWVPGVNDVFAEPIAVSCTAPIK